MNPDNFNAVDTAAGQAMIAKIQAVRAELLDVMGGPPDSSPEAYKRWIDASQSVNEMTLEQLEHALGLVKDLNSIKDQLVAAMAAEDRIEKASRVVLKAAKLYTLANMVVRDPLAYAMLSSAERAQMQVMADAKPTAAGATTILETWEKMALSEAQVMLLQVTSGCYMV